MRYISVIIFILFNYQALAEEVIEYRKLRPVELSTTEMRSKGFELEFQTNSSNDDFIIITAPNKLNGLKLSSAKLLYKNSSEKISVRMYGKLDEDSLLTEFKASASLSSLENVKIEFYYYEYYIENFDHFLTEKLYQTKVSEWLKEI